MEEHQTHMSQETTRHDRNLRIFREELEDFVPDKVLDFHVHVFCENVVPRDQAYSCAGHPLDHYDLVDLAQDLDMVYPGRTASAVCFGLPHLGYDRELNNRYLAESCDHSRFFPARLFDPLEDAADTVGQEIVDGGFVGLKPYLDYVRKEDANQVEIKEMLPDWIMEIANDLHLIIVLHIPRALRLADPVNQDQVAGLCSRYPKAQIVLAHIGRAYFLKNIVGQLDGLKGLTNLWYDLAMLNNWEVLEYLFANVSPNRILYATDIPVALAPGKSVEINDQYTYVTPVPWSLSISDDHGKLRFTSFLYEQLRAMQKACLRLGLDRQFVEGIFYGNGMQLLSMTKQKGCA